MRTFLRTHRSNLDLTAVFHLRDDGQDAVQRKVDFVDRFFRLINLLAQRQLHQDTVFKNRRRTCINKCAQN